MTLTMAIFLTDSVILLMVCAQNSMAASHFQAQGNSPASHNCLNLPVCSTLMGQTLSLELITANRIHPYKKKNITDKIWTPPCLVFLSDQKNLLN